LETTIIMKIRQQPHSATSSYWATVPDEDFAIALLSSLPESYNNLTVALESRANDLTRKFVTT